MDSLINSFENSYRDNTKNIFIKIKRLMNPMNISFVRSKNRGYNDNWFFS